MKVEPIRDLEKLKEFKNQFENPRNLFLVQLGLNTGLRISDLIKLKVKDVKNNMHIHLKEKKTGKTRKVSLNDDVRALIDDYIESQGLDDEDYLFQSRKGENQPISRVQAYRIIKEAGEQAGIERVGTHTLRKTFGYHHYKKNKDVATLQLIFNHSDPAITLEYIGIQQDEIDNSVKGFFL